ncbi:ubiquitin-like-specific protease ESD4 [Triticum dicoccoides]|uniref:ubiquitin-like-specific protease ESD4 n=1 Tax=Triticum dicoccoides TaxID=85692 RepID=UPI00189141B5|nr:ubiquitin-like-specific protease ESD4 [Triticum dicoccoides]
MFMQIFLPLNAGLHWYLAALDALKREVRILNSAPAVGPMDELDHALEAITAWFQQAEERIKQLPNPTNWPDFNVATWDKKTIKGLPTQKDGSSCGLYLLKYIMLWTGSKLSKTFSKKDIDMYRRQLAHDILNSDRNLLRKNQQPTRQRQFLTMKFLPKKERGPGRAPAVELHNRYGFRIDIRLKSTFSHFLNNSVCKQ